MNIVYLLGKTLQKGDMMNREIKINILMVVIVAIIIISIFYFVLIEPITKHENTRRSALDRFQRIDWEFPKNTTVDWNHSVYPYPIHGTGHWWKTKIYINYDNEPWNNGYWTLWLNFHTGDKYIENLNVR